MSWKCPFWNFGNSFSSFTPFAIIFSSLFQRVISLSSSSLIVISLADRIFLFFIRNSIRLSFFFYQKMPSVTVINGHYLFSYSIIMIYFRFALTRSRSQTGNRQNLSLAFRSSIFRHQETNINLFSLLNRFTLASIHFSLANKLHLIPAHRHFLHAFHLMNWDRPLSNVIIAVRPEIHFRIKSKWLTQQRP